MDWVWWCVCGQSMERAIYYQMLLLLRRVCGCVHGASNWERETQSGALVQECAVRDDEGSVLYTEKRPKEKRKGERKEEERAKRKCEWYYMMLTNGKK